MSISIEEWRNQVRNIVVYLGPSIVSVLLPILSIPIYTALLTPEDFGSLAICAIFAIVVGGIANCGLTVAFERNFFRYAKYPSQLGEMLFSNLFFVCAVFFGLFSLMVVFVDEICQMLFGSAEYSVLLILVTLAHFVSNVASLFFFNFLKNAERAITFSTWQLTRIVGNFSIGVSLVYFLNQGVYGIAWAQLIVGSAVLVALLISVISEAPIGFCFRKLKEGLRIGIWLLPRVFVDLGSTHADKYMLSLWTSLSSVGIYDIGKRVAEVLFRLMTAMENVFIPQTYKMLFNDDSEREVGGYLTPFFFLSVVPGLLLVIIAFELFHILTPEEYHDGIPVLIVLSMFYTSMFFGKVTGTVLLFCKKMGVSFALNIARAILNIALNIPMIIHFGIIGAAWATLFAGLIVDFAGVFYTRRLNVVRLELRKIGVILAGFYCTSIVSLAIFYYEPAYWVAFFLKLVCIGLFITVGSMLGIVSRRNLRIFAEALKIKRVKVSPR